MSVCQMKWAESGEDNENSKFLDDLSMIWTVIRDGVVGVMGCGDVWVNFKANLYNNKKNKLIVH